MCEEALSAVTPDHLLLIYRKYGLGPKNRLLAPSEYVSGEFSRMRSIPKFHVLVYTTIKLLTLRDMI